MITEIIKEHKLEVYEMVQRNNSAKSLLKQIDGIWKKIEVILQKDLKRIMKGK
tara:strand:+ start:1305 stop:1463 length:159 start_codon:yes stop_codon:yes gene_type:complete